MDIDEVEQSLLLVRSHFNSIWSAFPVDQIQNICAESLQFQGKSAEQITQSMLAQPFCELMDALRDRRSCSDIRRLLDECKQFADLDSNLGYRLLSHPTRTAIGKWRTDVQTFCDNATQLLNTQEKAEQTPIETLSVGELSDSLEVVGKELASCDDDEKYTLSDRSGKKLATAINLLLGSMRSECAEPQSLDLTQYAIHLLPEHTHCTPHEARVIALLKKTASLIEGYGLIHGPHRPIGLGTNIKLELTKQFKNVLLDIEAAADVYASDVALKYEAVRNKYLENMDTFSGKLGKDRSCSFCTAMPTSYEALHLAVIRVINAFQQNSETQLLMATDEVEKAAMEYKDYINNEKSDSLRNSIRELLHQADPSRREIGSTAFSRSICARDFTK